MKQHYEVVCKVSELKDLDENFSFSQPHKNTVIALFVTVIVVITSVVMFGDNPDADLDLFSNIDSFENEEESLDLFKDQPSIESFYKK